MPPDPAPSPRPHAARPAHAKLNLALAVLPAGRGESLHPIASWFAPIDLHDDVFITALEPGTSSTWNVDWADDAPRPSIIDWPLEKDLAVRAHKLLEQHTAHELPVAGAVVKRIPAGGGLGGGSSDAAAVLLALRDLFRLDLDDDALAHLSRPLGSDTAYFIANRPPHSPPPHALVTGRGDQIHRIPAVPFHAALILPDFGCSTGDVYLAFDSLAAPAHTRDDVLDLISRSQSRGGIDPSSLFNDLAAPAISVQPALAPLIARATEVAGSPVHITGSGSTLFSPANDADAAADLAARLTAALSPSALAVPVHSP